MSTTIYRNTNPSTGQSEGVNWHREYVELLNKLHDILSEAMTKGDKFDLISALDGVLFEDSSYTPSRLPTLGDWKKSIQKEEKDRLIKKLNGA